MRRLIRLLLGLSLGLNIAFGVGLFYQTRKLRTTAFLSQIRQQALENAKANCDSVLDKVEAVYQTRLAELLTVKQQAAPPQVLFAPSAYEDQFYLEATRTLRNQRLLEQQAEIRERWGGFR